MKKKILVHTRKPGDEEGLEHMKKAELQKLKYWPGQKRRS
jgi:hypothetical protein